ncbi:MAG TPA: isoprenylcysteine carboxylmethyltransferase family protein [Bacteroidia bacterium]|nr:isoprenylcysteine carboxylmethyltransferase family protein [Bacteroidia bacterium]
MGELIQIISIAFPVSEVLLFLLKRTGKKQGAVKGDKGSVIILWSVIFAAVYFSMVLSAKFPRNNPIELLQASGIVIFIVGAIIRWIAIVQLGRYFTVDVAMQPSHRIKNDGLFTYVRHPSYTGLVLEFLGFSLLFNSWYPLFIMNIPIFIALVYRMHIEEAMLLSHFGDPYRDYMSKRKRIFPFVF